jgi:hypothetical protein
MTKNLTKVLLGLGVAVALATTHACGGSSSPAVTPPPDAGLPDAGQPDAGPVADCFTGTPTTNEQFLNACTPDTVAKVLKTSSIQRGKANLPPLP